MLLFTFGVCDVTPGVAPGVCDTVPGGFAAGFAAGFVAGSGVKRLKRNSSLKLGSKIST